MILIQENQVQKQSQEKTFVFLFKKHNVWEFGVWTPHLNSKKQSK
jgi:hypothetical protein